MHIKPAAFENAGKKTVNVIKAAGDDIEKKVSEHIANKATKSVAQETKTIPLSEIPNSSLSAYFGPMH